MPHTSRRPRCPNAGADAWTSERIADALERAVALRCRVAVDPDDVRAIALTVSEAARSAKQRRAPVPWDHPEERDPWVMVGWVAHQRDWGGVADGRWWDRYDRAWEVWLDAGDGRVWLRPSRLGRRPKDDPCP